jgi:hypothetical protein
MRPSHAVFVFVWLGASVTASAQEPYRIGRVYLWYGTLGSRRGFWVWIPVHTTSNPGCFSGLGIVPAKLCSAGEPNCDA